MPDDMTNLSPDAFWYLNQQKKQPGFLSRLGSALPDILGAGIAGAATPNIAFGGPTDIFRAMQAGGKDREQKDILAFKRRELEQKDASLADERAARAADLRSKPGLASRGLDIREEQLSQKKIRDAAYIGSLGAKAAALRHTAAYQDAHLAYLAAKAGFQQDYGENPPPTEADQPDDNSPMPSTNTAGPSPRPPMAVGPKPPEVQLGAPDEAFLEAPPSDTPPAPTGLRNPMAAGPRPAPAPAQTGEFDTKLSPEEENAFQEWKAHFAPNDSGQDYDLRGAFQAGLEPDPETGHWPDTFKKPNHPTFSVESKYASAAPDKAGHWDGPNHDQYVPAGQGAAPPADVMITPPADEQPADQLGAPAAPQIVPPAPPAAPTKAAGIFPRPQSNLNRGPQFVPIPRNQLPAQQIAQIDKAEAQTAQAKARTTNLLAPKPVKPTAYETNKQKLEQYKKDNPKIRLTPEQEQQALLNGRIPTPARPGVVRPMSDSSVPLILTPQQETLLGVKKPVSGDRNEEFLASLPADAQTYIKGLADYDLEPPSQYRQTRDPQAAAAILRAKQYDPTYDSKEYPARSAMMKDYKSNKKGSTGGQISSLNTLTRHIASMQELAEAMRNHDTKLANRVINKISTEMGKSEVTNFESAKDAVSTELSTALKGQATEADIKAWRDTIDPNSSPDQLLGGTKTKLSLMLSRLKSIQDSYSRAMGGTKQYPLLDRETADTFIKYGLNPGEADVRFNVSAPGGQGPQQPRRRVYDPRTGKLN